MFAPTSFWNDRLPDSAPVDPDSAAYVADLGRHLLVGGEASGTRASLAVDDYGHTLWFATAATPRQKVWFDSAAENDALRAAIAAVPIPWGFRPAGGVDKEATILDVANDVLYEFNGLLQSGVDQLRAGYEQAGWHCRYATVINEFSKSAGNAGEAPAGSVGAGISGSGMHQMGGNIRISEAVFGRIRHPIKFQGIGHSSPAGSMIAGPHIYRWPATTTDGESSTPHAIQEGMRFRLPRAACLAALATVQEPFLRTLLRGAYEYGLILTDGSAAHVTIFTENRKTLPNSSAYGWDQWKGSENKFGGAGAILRREPKLILEEFPWDQLVVVSADYRPTGAPAYLL
jgi:hypothetical protein